MNNEITEAALTAAKKARRRKYGYTRNNELMTCGRMVIIRKIM